MSAGRLPICAWVTLTAAFALLPFGAEAQQARRPYRIGVLNEAWAANHPTVEGLKAGLRDLGFEEGRDVTLDVRFTEGKPDTTAVAAAALVKAGVDLIFTSNEGDLFLRDEPFVDADGGGGLGLIVFPRRARASVPGRRPCRSCA